MSQHLGDRPIHLLEVTVTDFKWRQIFFLASLRIAQTLPFVCPVRLQLGLLLNQDKEASPVVSIVATMGLVSPNGQLPRRGTTPLLRRLLHKGDTDVANDFPRNGPSGWYSHFWMSRADQSFSKQNPNR